MDKEVEQEVFKCTDCQEHRKAPPIAPLHPWEWPEQPWSRLHVDYAGPFLGKMFLVTADTRSKWLDVYPVKNATFQVTIEKLLHCFSIF